MNKKVEFKKVRDFGEIINDSFVFIGQNWKAILKAYAVICGFFIIASLATAILNQIKMADVLTENLNPYSFSRYRFGTEYFLYIAFAVLAYTMVTLTTFSFIALYIEKGNEAPSTEEVWGYVKFYFLRVAGSSILLSICLIIGFILCFIPGLYLWPALSLVIPIIVFENTSFGFGFNRAFQLIKDNYWSTLGVLVISVIIVFAGAMVFVLPITIFTTGSILMGAHKLNSTYLILNAIATHICMVLYILPYITISFTYFSLAEQKDGTGLMSRIEKLGTPESDTDKLPSEEY